jgi:hypothetical protein
MGIVWERGGMMKTSRYRDDHWDAGNDMSQGWMAGWTLSSRGIWMVDRRRSQSTRKIVSFNIALDPDLLDTV